MVIRVLDRSPQGKESMRQKGTRRGNSTKKWQGQQGGKTRPSWRWKTCDGKKEGVRVEKPLDTAESSSMLRPTRTRPDKNEEKTEGESSVLSGGNNSSNATSIASRGGTMESGRLQKTAARAGHPHGGGYKSQALNF